ncbi:BA71V-C315R [Elysia marginata]|uniref:BA71V-C315R n=1 Tax=Elysia marginata TaxID=1093978 RepID=A0AAV4GUL2_9GAST|nr:BA71V-C315R [Elysia marginata]
MLSSSAARNDPYGVMAASGDSASGDGMLDGILAALESGIATTTSGTPVGGGSKALSRLARPGDACPECRCALQISGIEYECPACHEVFEAADIQDVLPNSTPEMPGSASLRGRLRIVGPEAGWFQPDMDRTNPGESSEQQKKLTYAELLCFNKEYESRGGNPFPKDVLRDVAENYNIIQRDAVKRSMMKRGILAALVFHACISRGFTRARAEAAEFAKLPNHGIARGDDFLRSIDEDRGLDIDMNKDRLRPHIITTFAHLDLAEQRHEPLREAVAAIVKIAKDKSIGFRSVMRSKVAATTAEVLRRKKMDITPLDISAKCRIRIHTIRRFLDELEAFHSHFEDTYRAYGLEASRIGADATSMV